MTKLQPTIKNEQELKQYVLWLLSRREYSLCELYKKCLRFQNDENIINQVLQEACTKNYQSDKRFAENFIHSKATKYGSLRLKEELKYKGVNETDFTEFLPTQEEELQQALAVLKKKFKIYSNNKQLQQKYLRFLVYRGYSYDTAYLTINSWQEQQHH